MMAARALFVLVTTAFVTLFTSTAFAHKASDSLLTLEREGIQISGQWDIALRDLDVALGLDADGNGDIQWSEVKARHADIARYATSRLTVQAGDSPCSINVTEHLLDRHTDGTYAVLRLKGLCKPNSADATLKIDYRLLFDIDAQHRGLLKLTDNGQTRSAIFPANNAVQEFRLHEPKNVSSMSGFIVDGIKHIAIGFDHILFLVALLLPAVLVRNEKNGSRWLPVTTFRKALFNVASIVTAFTIAHSITLSLATIGVVTPPARWIEILIAVSVVITAIDNVTPIFPPSLRQRRWLIAFAFGLIHGFGFASVLQELNLPSADLVLSLVGFNIGVELGQLALVAVLLPVAYLFRARSAYPRIVLAGGSMLIAFIASGWLLERSLDFQFMPF
jgi:HupE / UreJ protein